ncbi:FG-GAP repeat protein [Nitrosomonas sp. Nm166]|uniref:FG-GAP repeat protein n=1 Tax=Nitrosomonas sp. Nm166 TaxID=1881054 RepID=UPI0008F2729A|nr:FG-GAP repeat protein [Nitrosomonas sp. Nm166]SFF14583.1 FG-GAP repeat-containing protein [Nitrosomonas sp. Nm166]
MATTVINLSSLDGSNGFRLDGESADDPSGSVRNAGDVNGDGFDDVIVGTSPDYPSSNVNYVVFGKASGFDATMNLSSLDGSNGFRLDGDSTYDRSLISARNAGDVNGDGFDDLIVDNRGFDVNGGSSRAHYVMFGKASGFDASLDISNLDDTNSFRFDGLAELSAYDFFS